MRRSFSGRMGGGAGGGSGGGGGGGGGMLRTVHRTVRAGVGGGASQEPFTHSATAAGRTNPNSPTHYKSSTVLSLSSSSSSSSAPPPFSALNFPISAAYAAPNWMAPPKSPTCDGDPEFDWECIDGIEEDGFAGNGVLVDDFVFDRTVPSVDEVQHAVSSLEQVLDPISMSQFVKDRIAYSCEEDGGAGRIISPTGSSKSGSELDWIEPSPGLYNTRPSPDRVYDAFHLLRTEPMVKRLVIALSSDKAVWDAVLNNEVVQELRESLHEVEKSVCESSDEEDADGGSDSATFPDIMHWVFVNTKAKVMEMVEKIAKLVNALFQAPTSDDKKAKEADGSPFEEKLRSSLMLTVVVLLIVVVSRAHKA